MQYISIAKSFSVYPGGRTPEDGKYSGEEFRTTFLLPILQNKDQAEIDFDGTRGYGSSFLDEAFGGLIRLGYTGKNIKDSFKLTSTKKSYIIEVNRYIEAADDKFQSLLKSGRFTSDKIIQAYKIQRDNYNTPIEEILNTLIL